MDHDELRVTGTNGVANDVPRPSSQVVARLASGTISMKYTAAKPQPKIFAKLVVGR